MADPYISDASLNNASDPRLRAAAEAGVMNDQLQYA